MLLFFLMFYRVWFIGWQQAVSNKVPLSLLQDYAPLPYIILFSLLSLT